MSLVKHIEMWPKEDKTDILKAFSLFQIKSRTHNDILMKDSHETKRWRKMSQECALHYVNTAIPQTISVLIIQNEPFRTGHLYGL